MLGRHDQNKEELSRDENHKEEMRVENPESTCVASSVETIEGTDLVEGKNEDQDEEVSRDNARLGLHYYAHGGLCTLDAERGRDAYFRVPLSNPQSDSSHTSRRMQGDRTRAASGQGAIGPSTSQALLRVSEPPSPPPTAPLPLPPLPAGNQIQPVMMVQKAGLASLAAQVHAVISGGEDQRAPIIQAEKGKSRRLNTLRPQTAPDVVLTSQGAPRSHAGASSVASLQKGTKSVAFLRHRPKVSSLAVDSVNSDEHDDDDDDSDEGSNVSSDLSRTSEDVMKKLSEVQRLRALHSELDLQRLRLASQARETSSSPRRAASSSTPRSVKYTAGA